MTPTVDLAKALNARNPDPSFENKVILVTGASRGIGKSLAISLGQRGATVILMARNEEALNTVYDQIVEAGGPTPVIVATDFTNLTAEGARELAEQIGETFGRLDGLAHVGALLGGREPIQTHRPAQWADVMAVNLNAVFYLTQALLPWLDQSPAGRIVMATSSVGYEVNPYWGAYAVSKAGLEMFTAMLAEELDTTSSTRVLTVNPGGTRTAMRAEAKPGEDPASLPGPDLVAESFVFGLTEEAGAFHGQRLNAREWMASVGTWPAL